MNNFVQEGTVGEFTAPSGGVVSGTAYKFEDIVCIATVDADTDVNFTGLVVGVVNAAKATGAAWAMGEKVYFAAGASNFTTTAGGNTLVGVAWKAADSGDTTGWVRLDGVAR